MINKDEWINSLPNINNRSSQIESQLDYDKWINTIPKKNAYNSVKKYSLMAFLFIFGLLLVSAVKNETRNLQKIINNLEASIDEIRFNLDQATLDNEVITSPENISRLAKEYLDGDLVPYKKSQIKQLKTEEEALSELKEPSETIIKKKKSEKLKENIKLKVIKKIEQKKMEIQKLQELYNEPKKIPNELKNKVAKKIEKAKIELKELYSSPEEIFTLERAGRWGVVQVVKVFFGMPIIPGR